MYGPLNHSLDQPKFYEIEQFGKFDPNRAILEFSVILIYLLENQSSITPIIIGLNYLYKPQTLEWLCISPLWPNNPYQYYSTRRQLAQPTWDSLNNSILQAQIAHTGHSNKPRPFMGWVLSFSDPISLPSLGNSSQIPNPFKAFNIN